MRRCDAGGPLTPYINCRSSLRNARDEPTINCDCSQGAHGVVHVGGVTRLGEVRMSDNLAVGSFSVTFESSGSDEMFVAFFGCSLLPTDPVCLRFHLNKQRSHVRDS